MTPVAVGSNRPKNEMRKPPRRFSSSKIRTTTSFNSFSSSFVSSHCSVAFLRFLLRRRRRRPSSSSILARFRFSSFSSSASFNALDEQSIRERRARWDRQTVAVVVAFRQCLHVIENSRPPLHSLARSFPSQVIPHLDVISCPPYRLMYTQVN